MDYTQRLLDVGLPCVSALDAEEGGIDAVFTRDLSAEEWQLYLRTVKPPTWEDVRKERRELLAACDWTQLGDAVLSFDERAAWGNYRQALRDVPQTFTNPEDVIWPEVP